jgi:hypothetical protein
VRDQVSHPYKTTGKIIILYILNFTLLGRREEDLIWLRTKNTKINMLSIYVV